MDRYLNQIICGDCLEVMKGMPDKCVDCCITSPPYWGLRDYGVEGQLGLESTPEEYVSKMVTIFHEVKRALRDDGTLWLNLGDTYGTGTRADRRPGNKLLGKGTAKAQGIQRHGYEAKQLVGIPWRVAFALQADGWYLRSDIIWHKPNPMPESVKDRPTKAHEYIFLMSKSQRYFYDHEAIKEKASPDTHARYARGRSDHHKWADGGPGNQTIAKSFNHMLEPGVNPKARLAAPVGWNTGPGSHTTLTGRYQPKQNPSFSAAVKDIVDFRNKRSVWNVATQPFKEAHFATFPPKLIEPCILAGCPESGIVLDPFMGAATTAVTALDLGRQYIGIEISPEYCAIAEERIRQATRQERLFV